MRKKAVAIVVSLAALAYAGLAFAEELAVKPESAGETSRAKRVEVAQEFKTKMGEWKTERQQSLEKMKQEKERLRGEFKEKLTQDRCTKIETRMQNQTAKLGSTKVKHMSVYGNLLARLDKFIKRFEDFNATSATDIDAAKIAKLKADRAQLVVLIDAFKASYDQYSAKISSTKKFTCASSEGEVRGSLADTRVYLKTVHDNAALIRTYVRETILPDLLTVKKEIARIKGEAGNKGEDKNDNNNVETPDATAPTVSITSPADGSSYSAAATITIFANATDNNKVEKVEFYDGAVLKVTDEEAPYSYDWSIANADSGTHSWTAKAYDDAEPSNTAVSTAVNLTVNISQ